MPETPRPKRPFHKTLILPALLCAVAIAGGSCLQGYIPSLYQEEAREIMVEERKQQYEADFDAAWNELLANYDAEMASYTAAEAQYETDLASFQSAQAAYEAEAAAYEAEYQQKTAQYEADLAAVEQAKVDREAAREKAYADAEAALLRAGLPFTVSAYRRMDYNSHVGNEWYSTLKVNGTEVSGSTTMNLKPGSNVSFWAEVVEDDSIPDVGRASGSCSVTQDYCKNGFTYKLSVTVRENRGRYSGNTAGFTIEYTFTPQPYTVTIDESKLPVIPASPTKPGYDPPTFSQTEPVPPVEPTRPEISDVAVEEPDYTKIQPTRSNVFAYCPAAKTQNSAVSFGMVAVVALSAVYAAYLVAGRKKELRIQLEKEEKLRLAQEEERRLEEEKAAKLRQEQEERERIAREKQRIAALRADFFSTTELPGTTPLPGSHAKYSCEEEKLLNLRLQKMLRDQQTLEQLGIFSKFLEKKAQHPYLQEDPSLVPQLQELQNLTRNRQQEIQNNLENFPDPLRELSGLKQHLLLHEVVPDLWSSFSTSTNDPVLPRFFGRSNVRYRNADNGTVLILTAAFFLLYNRNSHRLSLISLDRTVVQLREGQKQVLDKAPKGVDILGQHWLHETKKGQPDKRYAYNPIQYICYDAQMELTISSCKLSVQYSQKQKATDACQNVRKYCMEWGVTKNSDVKKLLNSPCKESLPRNVPSIPAFLKDSKS